MYFFFDKRGKYNPSAVLSPRFTFIYLYIYNFFLQVMAQIESPGRTGGIERGGNTMRPSKKKRKEKKNNVKRKKKKLKSPKKKKKSHAEIAKMAQAHAPAGK